MIFVLHHIIWHGITLDHNISGRVVSHHMIWYTIYDKWYLTDDKYMTWCYMCRFSPNGGSLKSSKIRQFLALKPMVLRHRHSRKPPYAMLRWCSAVLLVRRSTDFHWLSETEAKSSPEKTWKNGRSLWTKSKASVLCWERPAVPALWSEHHTGIQCVIVCREKDMRESGVV